MTLRLGILSAADIANVIVNATKHVPKVEVVAVASRTAKKAEAFAARHNIPRTCTYDELIDAEDVDALYIPLPTALAQEWAVRAAQSGKHILVDKPFASLDALQSIIEAANAAPVVFLDGTHFVHAARTKETQDNCDRMGTVRVVSTCFCAPISLDGNIRKDASLEPLGAIGDLGWYCSRAAVMYFGVDRTRDIRRVVCLGSVMDDAPGIVKEASGVVMFRGGEKLIVDCGFETVLRMRVEVAGTKGCMRVNDFVIPHPQFDDPGTPTGEKVETVYETEIGKWFDNGFPSVSSFETKIVDEGSFALQTVRMVREFERMIREKDFAAMKRRAEESVNTQRIVDALHKECMRNLKKE